MDLPAPKFVSFDAAQTLLRVNWDPGQVALQSLRACEVECDTQIALETYLRLLHSRWGDYKERNLKKDHAAAEEWWVETTHEWGRRMGWDSKTSRRILKAADNLLYKPESDVFSLFPDTLPCLNGLKERGVRCAVLSNWDFSLHRLLRIHGIRDFFEFVLCSDEEGFQKPETAFFNLLVSQSGVAASEILHVGDSPVDDVQGARSAGMRGVLIDREGAPGPNRITTLTALLTYFP